MYGCKTWLLTTEEERKTASKNKRLRKYYDQRQKKNGRKNKANKTEVGNVCCLPGTSDVTMTNR